MFILSVRLTLQVTLNVLHTVATTSRPVHGGGDSCRPLRASLPWKTRRARLPWDTRRTTRTVLYGRVNPIAEVWIWVDEDTRKMMRGWLPFHCSTLSMGGTRWLTSYQCSVVNRGGSEARAPWTRRPSRTGWPGWTSSNPSVWKWK